MRNFMVENPDVDQMLYQAQNQEKSESSDAY